MAQDSSSSLVLLNKAMKLDGSYRNPEFFKQAERLLNSHTQENADDLHPATTVGGKYTDLVKNIISPSLHELLFIGRSLLGFLFVTSLKANLCTELTIQNTTENKCIMS